MLPRWRPWLTQLRLYSLCKARPSTELSFLCFFQRKQDKLEWLMMLYSDCFLSFRFWVKKKKKKNACYICKSLSPNTTSLFYYLLISVIWALLMTFLVDLRARTDAFCTLHFPVPRFRRTCPAPTCICIMSLVAWCQLSEESGWLLSTL